MKFSRGSGILMHLTSLPGPFGIGDLGEEAQSFVDFLAAAGQKYWQFLPLHPTCAVFHNSPYMSLSAFAGNPLLVDPRQLVKEGLLSKDDFNGQPVFSEYLVDFDQVAPYKNLLLHRAFKTFTRGGRGQEYNRFCESAVWLDDFALFMALREENDGRPWNVWPAPVAARDRKALAQCRQRLAGPIAYHKFVQYCFFRQWGELKKYANAKGIRLIGDIPIYVGWDSADVWAWQECFQLDPRTRLPTHVAGVPPDYFSDTGQHWGNPLYRWHDKAGRLHGKLYTWWRERFANIFRQVDIVRIDHFRGFEAYWEIPAAEETAVNGRWVKGPGRKIFTRLAADMGELPIIAEDLGVITQEVEQLRDESGFPGMKVLQFAFDSDAANSYLPHNFTTTNCVVYTGTHDNDTTLGWYLSPKVPPESKERALRYAGCPGNREIHWDFIRLAFSTVADLAIIPLQDILGFGSDCRMNMPSTTEGNWLWRCAPRFLTQELAQRLRDETFFYNRR